MMEIQQVGMAVVIIVKCKPTLCVLDSRVFARSISTSTSHSNQSIPIKSFATSLTLASTCTLSMHHMTVPISRTCYPLPVRPVLPTKVGHIQVGL